jgi:predicted nucleotidyltransferase
VRSAGVEFALVGGLAVSVWAEPRLTRDVDLAVSAADDAAAEEVVHRFVALGYTPVMATEHEVADRLSNVRLEHELLGEVVVDLLFASSGIEPETVASAQKLEILPDLIVPVASIGHLVAMKLLARDDRNRPADYDDLCSLLEVASAQDLEQARDAIDLIRQRGYDRGRDLAGDLTTLEQERSSREL